MVRHFGMIAGGTGITPMLQIIRAIVRGRATGDNTQVDLIFANVTPQDILLREDLESLAAEDKGIRIHLVLDKPPEGWTGGVGYVTADMITVSPPRPPFSPSNPIYISSIFVFIYFLTHVLAFRNGSPSLPVTSRFCSVDLLPWLAV